MVSLANENSLLNEKLLQIKSFSDIYTYSQKFLP
jgi:hypothetical protein